MSLRVKLVISFTVLLLLVVAAVGVVASRSIRTILVAQTDETLLSFTNRDPRPDPRSPEDAGGAPDGSREDGGGGFEGDREPFHRSVAELFVDPDGNVVFSEASGFQDDPDPLPDVSEIGDETGLMYLDSVDGELEYRAYVEQHPDGGAVVRAVPLDGVATATDELIRTLIIGGLGVLLIGGSLTWWTVRRSMHPVDEMVETAEAIAHGDLGRRVPDASPNSELGRLGGSLNEMLASIEHSLEVERDGRERLRRFVADASHELRTPLTSITGYAELQSKGGLAEREAEDHAWTRVDAEGRRMKRLIEDLLVLARLGQTMPLHISETDMAAVCRDAATDFAAADPKRPVTVTGRESVPIAADSERVHQVIANLLSNVSVHTPEGTEVTIDVTASGDGCEILVADTGPGIPADAIGHVFDRFYRADPSRSRTSGGSGLGLAIVQAIVLAHGGTIAAGNGPDGGAAFTISLPSEPATDDMHRAAEGDAQPAVPPGR